MAYGFEAAGPSAEPFYAVAFETELGGMAFCVGPRGLRALTFGHRNAESAQQSLVKSCHLGDSVEHSTACEATQMPRRRGKAGAMQEVPIGQISLGPQFGADRLIERLQAFARGVADDFCDVPVDFDRATDFTRRVWTTCRSIGCGRVCTYAELAARIGAPRAARAVGNALAANRTPLIIPCHRVIACGGRIGRYSAPGGSLMKRRLLALEANPECFGSPACG